MLIGANAAGIMNKIDSLHRIIKVFNPAVIFLQETKIRQRNKLKLNDYDVFENIRNHAGGGGLLTAVHKSLNSVVVTDEEDVEILLEFTQHLRAFTNMTLSVRRALVATMVSVVILLSTLLILSTGLPGGDSSSSTSSPWTNTFTEGGNV